MRKQIVAGNWKMNKTLQEGIDLAKSVNEMNEQVDGDVVYRSRVCDHRPL
jgi:triosephosphate isomerase